MPSACLPTVFQASRLRGDHFWEGGYTGNPALHPLLYQCRSRDIILVQINPIARDNLDDLRLPVERSPSAATVRVGGLR